MKKTLEQLSSCGGAYLWRPSGPFLDIPCSAVIRNWAHRGQVTDIGQQNVCVRGGGSGFRIHGVLKQINNKELNAILVFSPPPPQVLNSLFVAMILPAESAAPLRHLPCRSPGRTAVPGPGPEPRSDPLVSTSFTFSEETTRLLGTETASWR